MDLYTTIVGLYSQNRHEVLRVVNTAIHSKCNLSEGIEVMSFPDLARRFFFL